MKENARKKYEEFLFGGKEQFVEWRVYEANEARKMINGGH
jgi:hypothetical protein